jgi:hypothetical protein
MAALQERIDYLESKMTDSQLKLKDLQQSSIATKNSTLQLLDETDAVPIIGQARTTPLRVTKAQNVRGILCDVRFVSMRLQDSGSYKKSEGELPFDEPDASESSDKNAPPLMIETYFAKDGKREKTQIKITSKGLQELMKSTMKTMLSHEGGSVWKDRTVTLSTRNVPMIRCFDQLRAAAEGNETPPNTNATKKDRDELKSFVRIIEQVEKELFQNRESIRKTKEVDYENIWILFPPGAEIIAYPFSNMPQIFVVHRHMLKDSKRVITCWAYDWDGSELIRSLYDFEIPEFRDTKSVLDLPCYPLQYYEDPANGTDLAELRRRLIQRGKKFKKLCVRPPKDGPMFQCNGEITYQNAIEYSDRFTFQRLLFTDDPLQPIDDLLSHRSKFKVIIDAASYYRYGPGSSRLGHKSPVPSTACHCHLCRISGFRKCLEAQFKNPNSTNNFDNENVVFPTAKGLRLYDGSQTLGPDSARYGRNY